MTTSYMIRRTLCPWKIEELVTETVEYCRKSEVDEIVWITESPGMHQDLLPIERIRELIPGLRFAKERTEAAGMIFSINPLTTIGHGEHGRDLKRIHPEMEFMIDASGVASKTCACPLSPYWRQLMFETFQSYAETRPTRLWVEDDFRYFNNGLSKYSCFCDRHLEDFGKRTGERLERDELASLLFRSGAPTPQRKSWLRFLGDTLSEFASQLAQAVHAVSNETQMGWMSINPSLMDVYGTNARGLLDAFANGRRAAVRLKTTAFQETGCRDMASLDENIKKILPEIPKNTLKCTEIETCPHSLYNKSAAGIAAQIEWANILGVTHHTLNIFDYIGSPMSLSPTYGETLRSRKEEFESFARHFSNADAPRGVGVVSSPNPSGNVHAETGGSFHEFAVRGDGWTNPLRAFGVPIVYGNDQAVSAATGQSLRSLNGREIETLFSRGVLLDGSALATLDDMGFSRFAGATVGGLTSKQSMPLGSEELIDPDFGGGQHVYVWMNWPKYMLKLDPNARMISRIVDTNGDHLFAGFSLFENELGGRVATCPFDLGGAGLDPVANRESPKFYSEYRQRQIQEVISWLGNGRVPLIVDANGWVLPHRVDAPGDKTLFAAMNLNLDEWREIHMRATIESKPKEVSWADIHGRWRVLDAKCWSFDAGLLSVHLTTPVPPLRTIAVKASH